MRFHLQDEVHFSTDETKVLAFEGKYIKKLKL
jgi:hypothetical protein